MILLDLDANLVRPGWTPLLITIALAVALVLLGLSMRKQMRRIDPNLPSEADVRAGRTTASSDSADAEPADGDATSADSAADTRADR